MRAELAAGFDRSRRSLREGMDALAATGHLQPGVVPDRLGDTLLATVQGRLLLSQIHHNETPLATALDTVLVMALRDDAEPHP